MSKAKKKKGSTSAAEMEIGQNNPVLGPQLSFAAAEAYKLLRANILFSLPDEEQCRIIGVTSSIRHEGKSTTSMNLAYTIAETGSSVVLLDGDMRLPVVAKQLGLRRSPGLSNLIAGQCTGNDCLQDSGLLDNLKVISAGDLPPNPSELLSSPQMETVLKTLAKQFKYIILDLPPITAVSDALVVSPMISGMIVVVAQRYSSRAALKSTMEQLKFANVNVLGFVMTRADTQDKRYGKYKHYGYGYGYYGHKQPAAAPASKGQSETEPAQTK